MFFLDKIFSHSSSGTSRSSRQSVDKKSKGLFIYLDGDLKKKLQTHNQTTQQYLTENHFDTDQYLYLLLKHRRNDENYSKRKLNPYEWFSDVLEDVPEEFKGFIVMGYDSRERSSAVRLSSHLPIGENPKCIRSGTLMMFSDSKNTFEECQLRLHHDYLAYYKVKAKQKRMSFMPLENSIVETMSENKYVFIVKDKFKNIVFKTTSKEDMIGWLLAISEAIKIRSSEIYLSEFDEKLAKSIKDKVASYTNKCKTLKDSSKVILLDEMGRKALKKYLQRQKAPEIDFKMLSIIESYLEMCRVRRERGESHSQPLMIPIKKAISQHIFTNPPSQQLKESPLATNQQFIKVIEQIMKHLDKKYRQDVIDKKYLNAVFQTHLTEEYKKNSRIPMKTFVGHIEINQQKQPRVHSLDGKSESPEKMTITNKQNILSLRFRSISISSEQPSPLRRLN